MEYLNIKCRDEDLLPSRAHDNDAGIDLLSDSDLDPTSVPVEDFPIVVDTGVSVDIPEGYVGLLTLRSSLGRKGWILPNAPGIIDSGYHGEIGVTLDYLLYATNEDSGIKRGDRIAQLVIVPVVTPWLNVVEEFEEETERGSGGFGSSGK